MEYRGKTLLLDNFRTVLKDYSLDVQDVVRSAILDGVDISEYIGACRRSAYRLDQIRLGIKESLPSIFYSIKNGEILYRIRQLRNGGKDVLCLGNALKKGTGGEESLLLLISWVEKEYDIDNIDVSIIPQNMIKSFEYGLQKGFDMKPFNDGRFYPSDYVRACLAIQANGRDIKPFVCKELWETEVLKYLTGYSQSFNEKQWVTLMSCLSSDVELSKVKALIACISNGVSCVELKKSEWSAKSIETVLQARNEGLDYNKVISAGPDTDSVSAKYNELALLKTKEKRVGGVLRKG